MRFISALILFVLILIFSAFAIINRTIVEIHFDFWNLLNSTRTGFEPAIENSFFVFEVPLYITVFVSVLVGMLFGMLLPLMNFFRDKSLAFQQKIRQPTKVPSVVNEPNQTQSTALKQ